MVLKKHENGVKARWSYQTMNITHRKKRGKDAMHCVHSRRLGIVARTLS